MFNKLAQLLPVLALVVGVPTFAGIAQANPHHGYRQIADGGMGGQVERLNFTPEQKTKIQQLRQSTRTQIETLLTPEQLPKFQQIESQRQAKFSGENGLSMRDRRQSMRDSWKSLNLTADQKAKMKAIRQVSKEQFKAILTPEQQAKFKGGRKD
jgi:Spy/CpxP family protein refolding chaperone